MKKLIPLALSLLTTNILCAQDIDSKVQAEYFTLFNNMSTGQRTGLQAINRTQGVLLVLELSVDTLNKNKFAPAPRQAAGPARKAGGKIGVMLQEEADEGREHYHHMVSEIVKQRDSFLLFAYTPDPFLLRMFYKNNFETFCSFQLLNKAGKYEAHFEEWCADSNIQRYRATVSAKNTPRIKVPLTIQSCAFNQSPLDKTNSVYGKAFLTTDAFYAKDDQFAGGYIYKRYRLRVLFRAPVRAVGQ